MLIALSGVVSGYGFRVLDFVEARDDVERGRRVSQIDRRNRSNRL